MSDGEGRGGWLAEALRNRRSAVLAVGLEDLEQMCEAGLQGARVSARLDGPVGAKLPEQFVILGCNYSPEHNSLLLRVVSPFLEPQSPARKLPHLGRLVFDTQADTEKTETP